MSIYVDSSAFLKRYIDEPDSATADSILRNDPSLLTARHTVIEVRRSLARLLSGSVAAAARRQFTEDLAAVSIIELDAATCESAAAIAETIGVRTLDALHLAAAQRVVGPDMTLLTFDLRQAVAARALGLSVVGS
jgi:uncharacterized protein